MIIYNALVNEDFTLSRVIARVAEVESDFGEYTDEDNISLKITIPENFETVLYLELLYNDDCLNFDKPIVFDFEQFNRKPLDQKSSGFWRELHNYKNGYDSQIEEL